MAELTILTDGVEMPRVDKSLMHEWIEAVARGFGKSLGDISYIFCNDAKILEVNRQFLNHDYFTDVITFDYSRPHRISGDIFISLDTVASNAEMVGATYERSSIGCLSMAFSTCAGSTTRVRASARLWSATRTNRLIS